MLFCDYILNLFFKFFYFILFIYCFVVVVVLLWMFHWQYPLFHNCQFLQDSTLILPPYREMRTLTATGTAVAQTKTLTTVTQKDSHLTHNHWPHPQRPRPHERHHHVTKHSRETTSRRLWPNKKKKTTRLPNGRFIPLTTVYMTMQTNPSRARDGGPCACPRKRSVDVCARAWWVALSLLFPDH